MGSPQRWGWRCLLLAHRSRMVMGPSVLFSCFLTGATLALYHGSPLGCGFGKFVQRASLSFFFFHFICSGCWSDCLGFNSKLSKKKSINCVEGLDWSQIEYYRPIIECCGGSELASCYIQGNLLRPLTFGAFSSPSLITGGLVILDEHGVPYPDIKLVLVKLVYSLCAWELLKILLNADPEEVYYKGMSIYNGMTSSVEIEHACDHPDQSILETAGINVAPPGGGPEYLVIFVVLRRGFDQQADKLKIIFTKAIQRLC